MRINKEVYIFYLFIQSIILKMKEISQKLQILSLLITVFNFIADINDIEKHCPGLMRATIEWFKIYKIPDKKPENQFAFNDEAKSRDFALHIVDEVHQHWRSLVKRDDTVDGIMWFVNQLFL